MSLIDKIKKSRESSVIVNDKKFTVRRPTDFEAISMGDMNAKQVLSRFVIGWAGMQEIDLIEGGDAVDVEFSTDLFISWSEGNLDVWAELIAAINDSYHRYYECNEKPLKKQKSG